MKEGSFSFRSGGELRAHRPCTVFSWASFCECRRLSPLFYEDAQIFLVPRPPRLFRGTTGSAGDGWAARSHTRRPGSAENGAGGLPLPGFMRIERLGKPAPSSLSNFQRSRWACPRADWSSVSLEAAQFARTARASKI